MLGRVSWPVRSWKLTYGLRLPSFLQILSIRLFGLDSVLPESGGGQDERGRGGPPSGLRFHGSSKETIYHAWTAKEGMLADTGCATVNFHSKLLPQLTFSQWYLLRVPTAALFFGCSPLQFTLTFIKSRDIKIYLEASNHLLPEIETLPPEEFPPWHSLLLELIYLGLCFSHYPKRTK